VLDHFLAPLEARDEEGRAGWRRSLSNRLNFAELRGGGAWFEACARRRRRTATLVHGARQYWLDRID